MIIAPAASADFLALGRRLVAIAHPALDCAGGFQTAWVFMGQTRWAEPWNRLGDKLGGCMLVDIQAFILSIGFFHHRQQNLSQASVTESSVALPPATGSTTMTTSAFSLRSDASAFDPDNIRILSNAFEDAWQSLHPPGTTFHLDGQADQAREILARCIIEMAKLGERDQRQLRDAARVHLAEANIRHARN